MQPRTINQILFEDGPQSFDQLTTKTGELAESVSEDLAALVVSGRVHLESDFTFWYSEPTDD